MSRKIFVNCPSGFFHTQNGNNATSILYKLRTIPYLAHSLHRTRQFCFILPWNNVSKIVLFHKASHITDIGDDKRLLSLYRFSQDKGNGFTPRWNNHTIDMPKQIKIISIFYSSRQNDPMPKSHFANLVREGLIFFSFSNNV